MYDENEKGVSLKGIFVKILLVVILLFILMMLFPTRGFVTNYVDEKTNNLSSDNFNNNLLTMANVASGYFNSSRLPENTGDTISLTLGEMLEQKMLVDLKYNNKLCDSEASYVEVTKEESEYTMKVNLSCDGEEDYIISHMGLEGDSFPSPSTTRCEFVKTNDVWSYGSWSEWSTIQINQNNNREVQTKVETVQNGTEEVANTTTEENAVSKYLYNGKTIYVCATSYDNAGNYSTPVTCIKTITTYETRPVYQEITYYRYRSKTLTTNTDTLWSNCDDQNLINEGYSLTGNQS